MGASARHNKPLAEIEKESEYTGPTADDYSLR